MRVIHDTEQPVETWRDGVETRMYVSAMTGAAQLTVFEQWCAPGQGAPAHLHAVEEVLRILAGQAEVWVGAERAELGSGASTVIAAGAVHGFRNIGSETLHVQAILAAPMFEAHYIEGARDSRRWNSRSA
jgi:mannose-6-phosphate isomerase-like protein (cupin superfamily)